MVIHDLPPELENELNNLGENDKDDDEEPGLVLFFSIFEWSLPRTQLVNVDGIVS